VLLPAGVGYPDPAWHRVVRFDDGDEAEPRENGNHALYVGPDDPPNAEEIRALSCALDALLPKWGAIAPDVAASCGLRWGEQFQLRASDVGTYKGQPTLLVDWQISASARAGTNRRKRPKGEKVRRVPIPEFGYTGYPLLQELMTRRDAALAEQAAGRNPEALLFPAKNGGLMHHSSFTSDYLHRAMEAAGWEFRHWTEETKTQDEQGAVVAVVKKRRTAVNPWHSLRHRYARFCIDDRNMTPHELMAAGGWEDWSVLMNRYYGTSERD
jgi:hypothetical protein